MHQLQNDEPSNQSELALGQSSKKLRHHKNKNIQNEMKNFWSNDSAPIGFIPRSKILRKRQRAFRNVCFIVLTKTMNTFCS